LAVLFPQNWGTCHSFCSHTQNAHMDIDKVPSLYAWNNDLCAGYLELISFPRASLGFGRSSTLPKKALESFSQSGLDTGVSRVTSTRLTYWFHNSEKLSLHPRIAYPCGMH
jgi:hypothetical protein